MPLSVVDLYKDILPKTNCGDCGFKSCLAFASMVVSEKHPIGNCPHLLSETVAECQIELEKQYAEGKWLKRDMAQDALDWARSRAAAMGLADIAQRIGGELVLKNSVESIALPYFADTIIITEKKITSSEGEELPIWEQVFLYNHMARGGRSSPTGQWKRFAAFPNTVPKVKGMTEKIEEPIGMFFSGKPDALLKSSERIGGRNIASSSEEADVMIFFKPLPRVPILLMFRDEIVEEGFQAKARLLFDENVTDHLDIESIVFLSEALKDCLCKYKA